MKAESNSKIEAPVSIRAGGNVVDGHSDNTVEQAPEIAGSPTGQHPSDSISSCSSAENRNYMVTYHGSDIVFVDTETGEQLPKPPPSNTPSMSREDALDLVEGFDSSGFRSFVIKSPLPDKHSLKVTGEELTERISMLNRLLKSDDPVHAIFNDLHGDPKECADILLRRLAFLQESKIISCCLYSAGEVMQHPKFPLAFKQELTERIGEVLQELKGWGIC